MFSVSRLFLVFALVLPQGQAFEEPECFQAILAKRSQDYESCYQLIENDQKMRVSQKKQKLDLLDRLIAVKKSSEDCEDQAINFLSQYGIKDLERPAQDMNPELAKFWEIYLGHCPKLKEKFQSE